MFKDDLISVIVPIYNVERYLSKCIDSIINQTYCNLEIILIDDGSPDNCGKICDEYAQKDKRIRVIHKENGGLSDARNKGIEAAGGKYIMFVDSDDYIDENMIFHLYSRMNTEQSDMAICRFVHVDENGGIIDTFESNPPYKNEVVSSNDILKWFSIENIPFFIVACCKLYKKELWDHIRFPENRIYEDEYVTHRIMGECKRISIVNEPFYNYVQRNGSITNASSGIKILDAVDAFLDRTDYYFYKNYNHEATVIYNRAIREFIIRVGKIKDIKSNQNQRIRQLKVSFKKIYIKNLLSLLKYYSLNTFIYVTLFIIGHKFLNFILKLLRKK